ncbi:MAG TPA: ferritin-like domain-containing protein [Allosphingosinicella sp.]|jgi:hypothetical protein
MIADDADSAPRAVLLKAAIEPGAGAAVTIPAGFVPRDYAIYLLHVAAEVEHALLVEYLFAAYSLGGPHVPEAHRDTVREWQTVLLGIAKEEMAHFVTVQNVLRLLGAPLNFEREDFPWDVDFAPFAFSLERLSAASLARYVYVESPEQWPADAEPYRKEITALAEAGQPAKPNRVGKLYELMIQLLSDPDLVPESAFQASTLPYQASWDEWGRGYRDGARGAASPGDETPDLIVQRAYSRASAVDALKAVAAQGEAPDRDTATGQHSHFRRFFELWKAFPKEGSWPAVRRLCPNPTTVRGLEGLTYIADGQTRHWAHLLNLRYRMLLTYLAHSFQLSDGSGQHPDSEARGLVLQATFAEMYNLRAVSNLLVTKPADEADGPRAGPPFEMPYSLALPAARADAWRLHVDLIGAAKILVERLRPHASTEEKAYLDSMAAIDARRRVALDELVEGAGGRRTRMGGWA